MRDIDIMADRLLQLSEQKSISVRKLAQCCGINETTLYMATERRSELSAKNIRKICRAMHVSADWILGLADSMNGGITKQTNR